MDRSYCKMTDNRKSYINKRYVSSHHTDKPERVGDKISISLHKDVHHYQPSAANGGQLKTQLEQSRSALSVMKTELQAKLNELSSKTIMNSAMRKSNNQNVEGSGSQYYGEKMKQVKGYEYSGQKSSVNKLSRDENKYYEEISDKYSRTKTR